MAANINLLPEVRVIKVKGAQRKRLATTVTIIIGAVLASVIVGLLLIIGYYAAQSNSKKSQANELQNQVNQYHNVELDADTLQEHLKTYASLNQSRIAVTEVFSQLVKVIPQDVSVSSFQLDEKYHASISGAAPNYHELGVFIQALESYNVTFKPNDNTARKPIFTNVTVSQSSKDASSGIVSYSLGFDVDSSIAKVNQANSNSGVPTGSPTPSTSPNQGQ